MAIEDILGLTTILYMPLIYLSVILITIGFFIGKIINYKKIKTRLYAKNVFYAIQLLLMFIVVLPTNLFIFTKFLNTIILFKRVLQDGRFSIIKTLYYLLFPYYYFLASLFLFILFIKSTKIQSVTYNNKKVDEVVQMKTIKSVKTNKSRIFILMVLWFSLHYIGEYLELEMCTYIYRGINEGGIGAEGRGGIISKDIGEIGMCWIRPPRYFGDESLLVELNMYTMVLLSFIYMFSTIVSTINN